MKIKENKKQISVFSDLYTGFKNFIDPQKEDLLLSDISVGIGNKIAAGKFPGFSWPLWLTEAGNFFSPSYRSYPNPVLLNTNFREWQTFTNYLSSDEIFIDRCGMVSGSGDAPWSAEFWFHSSGSMYRPQNSYRLITSQRDYKTGIIDIKGSIGNTQFRERIAGAKSSVNEALVSYEINAITNDDICFIVIRPYNNTSLGGLNSIEFEARDFMIKINGRQHAGIDRKPDFIYTGSGTDGDINITGSNAGESVFCNTGLAAMALGFTLKKGINSFCLRISLEKNMTLTANKFDLIKAFKEFQTFTEIRLNEGLKIEIPDEEFSKIFCQSRLTLLNYHVNDFNIDKIEGFRNLYFFSYAMNRTGQGLDSERIIHVILDKFKYDKKNPDYVKVICGSYLVNSFYECYIHKRESEFLQKYFPSLRQLGDYVYSYSTDIHSIEQLPGCTDNNNFIKEPVETDFIIILYAIINMSYLSRCMGIFGDEAKYKNEAERIQSIIRPEIEKKKNLPQSNSFNLPSLIAFPETVLTGYKSEEYSDFFMDLSEEVNYPVFNNLSGINLFLTVSILIHFIALKDKRFNEFNKRCLSLIDDFFVLPEFIDPVIKKGAWGSGNSKIIASLVFVLMRNRIFLDRADRLEIFPAPEEKWFIPGNKIKVQNAPTRYGYISFLAEISDTEIKLSFKSLPKFIPSDILINLPLETSIIESDDFILKRKVDNNYIINGWPSVIRFVTLKTAQSADPA